MGVKQHSTIPLSFNFCTLYKLYTVYIYFSQNKLDIAPKFLVRYDAEKDEIYRDRNGRCIKCKPGKVEHLSS